MHQGDVRVLGCPGPWRGEPAGRTAFWPDAGAFRPAAGAPWLAADRGGRVPGFRSGARAAPEPDAGAFWPDAGAFSDRRGRGPGFRSGGRTAPEPGAALPGVARRLRSRSWAVPGLAAVFAWPVWLRSGPSGSGGSILGHAGGAAGAQQAAGRGGDLRAITVGDLAELLPGDEFPAGIAALQPRAQFTDRRDPDGGQRAVQRGPHDSSSCGRSRIRPAGLRASTILPSAPYAQNCGVWAAPAACTRSKV